MLTVAMDVKVCREAMAKELLINSSKFNVHTVSIAIYIAIAIAITN